MPTPKKQPRDKKIIRTANPCPADKLSLKNHELACPVASVVSNDLIFVKKKDDRICNYYVPFGYGGFCKCPARKKLYMQYGL